MDQSSRGLLDQSVDGKGEEEEDDQDLKNSNTDLTQIATLLDNKAFSSEETKTVSHDNQTHDNTQRKNTQSSPLDLEEFTELDNKIKEGSATNDEEESYSKLVPTMAQLQVKDYQRTPEEEKQLLDEHKAKFDPEKEIAINTVVEYIDETMENYKLDVDYIWTFHDHLRHENR